MAAANQAANDAADDDNGPIPADDDGSPSIEEADEGWTDLESFEPVAFHKKEDPKDNTSAWIKVCVGKLRIQQSEEKKNVFRMIMRTPNLAAVAANILINKNTGPVAKVLPAEEGKKVVGTITFIGINDVIIGSQLFLMRSREEIHKPLMARLEDCISKVDG